MFFNCSFCYEVFCHRFYLLCINFVRQFRSWAQLSDKITNHLFFLLFHGDQFLSPLSTVDLAFAQQVTSLNLNSTQLLIFCKSNSFWKMRHQCYPLQEILLLIVANAIIILICAQHGFGYTHFLDRFVIDLNLSFCGHRQTTKRWQQLMRK